MRQDSSPPRSWCLQRDAASLDAADGQTVIARVERTRCGFAGKIYDAARRYAGSRRIWLTAVLPTLDAAMHATQETLRALEHSSPADADAPAGALGGARPHERRRHGMPVLTQGEKELLDAFVVWLRDQDLAICVRTGEQGGRVVTWQPLARTSAHLLSAFAAHLERG